MSEIDRLEAYIERLRAQVADLQAHREEEHTRMLAWRGIDVAMGDVVCGRCGGAGTRTYGSTATWHGGIGGQTITTDICDRCWGSGVENKPWLNLRVLSLSKIREGWAVTGQVELLNSGKVLAYKEKVGGPYRALKPTEPPTDGSTWIHRSGQQYQVLLLANLGATTDRQDEFPFTVVYKDGEGRIWSRPLSRWYDSFELLPGEGGGQR